jgi:uroporphyrinogen-III synthase
MVILTSNLGKKWHQVVDYLAFVKNALVCIILKINMFKLKLNKIKVLVTRPKDQANLLCHKIEAEGGEAVRFPVISILEIHNNNSNNQNNDFAIFISSNAVEKSLPNLYLSPQCQVFAVGKRTAETLKVAGITAFCPAPPFNSEALLEMPELQKIPVKKIVIFRGECGRELLAKTLQQRGAIVNYVNVYRRIQPPTPAKISPVDIITITSVQGLKHLLNMLEGQSWVKNTPLVVMSERIAVKAKGLGINAPIFVAASASDEGIFNAVLEAQTITP